MNETDIAEIAVEAIKTANILAPDRVFVDQFPDTRNEGKTLMLVSEIQSEYDDSFSSTAEYGIYRSTLQIVVVSRDSQKAKTLCREAAETVVRRFDEMTQPYTGPVHGVQRLGKEQGKPNDANYSSMFASLRTLLIIHQFEL